MTHDQFHMVSASLPQQPGIYKYFDAAGKLIYVGKAKNIRKRVSSYFVKIHDNFKTRKLVEHIDRIEFTIVDSEQDAFLLENSLIKQYQPRYNINLKDDKTYPFIVIKKEPFPRVFLTRKMIRDGSEYLGPFTGVGRVRELLEFIRAYIPLRTCALNLSDKNIQKGKYKVCLEYHLGNCKGPCEGLQSEEDYLENLQQVRNILKGNLGPVVSKLKEQMQQLATELKYEQADLIKRKLDALQEYRAKSTIVSSILDTLDVFSIVSEPAKAFVNYLQIMNGTIVQTKTIVLEKKLDESDRELLEFAMAHLREKLSSQAKELVVPFKCDFPEPGIICTVPKSGEKKKLLDLSEKNATYMKEEQEHHNRLFLDEAKKVDQTKVLEELQQNLHLSELPNHIECFDNSNFQGSYPVAACVVFKQGLPSKSDYRHFNVKTVTGINDFASMSEIVFRRYKRYLDEHKELPQLVIIDGGKGQLNAALKSLDELGIRNRMAIIGLAKNIEEVFFPGDQESLKLPYESDSLKLLRRIRDEVHRFGITFHRLQRSKGTFSNELEKIQGIGQQTSDLLLQHFKSVQGVKQAKLESLEQLVGPSRASKIWNYFHPN